MNPNKSVPALCAICLMLQAAAAWGGQAHAPRLSDAPLPLTPLTSRYQTDLKLDADYYQDWNLKAGAVNTKKFFADCLGQASACIGSLTFSLTHGGAQKAVLVSAVFEKGQGTCVPSADGVACQVAMPKGAEDKLDLQFNVNPGTSGAMRLSVAASPFESDFFYYFFTPSRPIYGPDVDFTIQ